MTPKTPDFARRFALGRVEGRAGEIAIMCRIPNLRLSLHDYSRFKHGDGAFARTYGMLLALHAIPACFERPGDIHVTASAYKVARPAAVALLAPFVHTARLLAERHGFAGRILPFRLHRLNLTHGDYATMNFHQRDAIIRQNGLHLPEDVRLEGKNVIALDDIRVTGLHETAMDALLHQGGAACVLHAYVLDVADGHQDPEIEARINHACVRNMDDLIRMAASRDFLVNARFCRRILDEPAAEIRRFAAASPLAVLGQLLHDAAGDELPQMPRYQKGFQELLDAYRERVEG
ncbi:MAG: phosphoribosyltransferase family protein [Zoogloeaceae bacterium]|jgi:hypothetical protein|nr:phosphoribosyltransferase family protein [Zoogloeaceae bacterium]